MIVVKLMGGMGNQMFQYAFGRYLSLKHNTILKMDLSFLLDRRPRENFIFRNYDLNIFNIQENFADSEDVSKFRYPLIRHKNRIIRKLSRTINIKPIVKPFSLICESDVISDEQWSSIPDNVYLDGYWAKWKYLTLIEQVLRKEFTFKVELNPECKEFSNKIKATNAICINVRRGDFVSNPTAIKFHGVCNMEYYDNCIKYIGEKVSNPHFFIFSDDISWCQKKFRIGYPTFFVTHNYAGKKFDSYLELMTLCRHYIIPNSTFGWWAAWLNKNSDKIVIAPKIWFADPVANSKIDLTSLYPREWIII